MSDQTITELTAKRAAKEKTAKRGTWLAGCVFSDTGKPLPVLASALEYLLCILPAHFALDEMACTAMLMLPLNEGLDFDPRPCTDVDVSEVQKRMQHEGLKRISRDTVKQAIDMRAHACRFHPVHDYLEMLVWDGEPRISNLFPVYFGSDNTDYARAIGVMFLIASGEMRLLHELPPFR